ncbi:hypothetical protein K435DRAFT_736067 [Dendrothele bispora CBS 962.96]|uniref:Small ribosomal subunit protein mS29 n=1 Tax=Dendrothele bispora (strain CBS 962.96) TaxID=1314807 RepID=A0A4S8KXA8_DENBC|nr:hypothetical protein K435DRAFT_736067 [Dendrothele bispora CBS 962.96]
MPATQLSHPLFESDNRHPISLPTFTPANITQDMIGQAVHFAELPNDPIKFYGTPKPLLLEYRLLSRRASVIRDVTVQTARLLDEAAQKSSKDTRIAITGSSGSGKSVLLLQAVRYCLENDWVVIYIPRAKSTVNSTTTHTYDLRTRTYLQPEYASQILRRILGVNSKLLSDINTKQSLSLERRQIPAGTSLSELATIGVKEQQLATVILDALMNELSAQKKYPVLLAIDDFQAIYKERTIYRDPHFAHIRPYHLSMPRLLLEFASGQRVFSQGAVLGAVTNTDPLFPISNELMWALGTERIHPTSPYDKMNKTLVEYTAGLKNLEVPAQFSLPEASAVFEVWMKDRAVSAPINDELFLSKYTESGGHPRSFVWKGLLATLDGEIPKYDPEVPWPQLREAVVV